MSDEWKEGLAFFAAILCGIVAVPIALGTGISVAIVIVRWITGL